jgi:hypothetical protein
MKMKVPQKWSHDLHVMDEMESESRGQERNDLPLLEKTYMIIHKKAVSIC